MGMEHTFTLDSSTGGLGPLGEAKSISTWGARTASKTAVCQYVYHRRDILSLLLTVVRVSSLREVPTLQQPNPRSVHGHPSRSQYGNTALNRGVSGEGTYSLATCEILVDGGEDEEQLWRHLLLMKSIEID